jgi:hypothetical protein
MKRPILACLVLLALAAVPSAAPAQSRGMFMNGDSLAVGTQPYFPSALPRWSIQTSASISRHAFEGPGVLRAVGRLPRVIAVSLGTNDDPRNTSAFRAAIRATMAVVGPARCVVWATVKRPAVAGATYGEYNRILREEAKRRPNLEVVRWARLAAQNPQWFGGDGVHPDATGYRARAAAYAERIRRCP